MIFDFYLSLNFNKPDSAEVEHIIIKNEPFYNDIIGAEESGLIRDGYYTCLYRGSYCDSFFDKRDLKVWVFGYVFTNNKYALSKHTKPLKLNASEILDLYLDDNESFVQHLKGSFVLVFADEIKKTIKVVTDRLNVLPLYYAYENRKLIISSNTALILKASWVNKEPDTVALAMQNLFDYMLGEFYFVKGIRRFENAGIYSFDSQKLEKTTYWDVSELYHSELLPKQESLDMLSVQLKENVNLYTSDSEKLLVSLTGGFDGRANLAMLERPSSSFKCFSYGMPGSKQIQIPKKVAEKTGINYEPVFLDQEFTDQYYINTLKAGYFSNGTAPVGFSNIPYTYKKLATYSDVIITGLFGSEILRPLHNNGIQVNEQSFSIFLNVNLEQGIEKAIKNASTYHLINDEYLFNSKLALLEYFNKNYFEKYKSYDKIIRFFFFIIQEGVRKYFSQEISIERVYVSTQIPYFDTDFVDLIYQTQWAGMYNGFLGESKFKRRKGQLLYAHIIKKYKPELGKILLDRGYAPNDLLLPFPFNYLKIGYGVYNNKNYIRKAGGNDTFKTEIWADETIKKAVHTTKKLSDQIFSNNLRDIYESGSYLNNYLTYRHFVTFHSYLNYCINDE